MLARTRRVPFACRIARDAPLAELIGRKIRRRGTAVPIASYSAHTDPGAMRAIRDCGAGLAQSAAAPRRWLRPAKSLNPARDTGRRRPKLRTALAGSISSSIPAIISRRMSSGISRPLTTLTAPIRYRRGPTLQHRFRLGVWLGVGFGFGVGLGVGFGRRGWRRGSATSGGASRPGCRTGPGSRSSSTSISSSLSAGALGAVGSGSTFRLDSIEDPIQLAGRQRELHGAVGIDEFRAARSQLRGERTLPGPSRDAHHVRWLR